MNFVLDSRLANDCEILAESEGLRYLLHNNAEVLWLILVPETDEIEFYQLPAAIQQQLCAQISLLSGFIATHNKVDKINVATIGNVVSQLHIHVIGRTQHDAYWPGVVWGQHFDKTYTPDQVSVIRQQLLEYLESAPAAD